MTEMNGKLGIHALVFTDQWTEENARKTCQSAADIGFDLIEVLMFDPYALDIEVTRRAVRNAGIGLRLGMALGPDADISSADPEVAKRGEETVTRALEIANDLGAPAVSGITYAAFNNYRAPPTKEQRDGVVAALGRLDRRAGELGLRLGVEPVNRYESYMVNTLDEAAALIGDAGGRNMFIHMDTFHMNIEETNMTEAIRRNASLLGYAHVAENHRGVLGTGQFDLKGYFRALAAAGYKGDFTAEAFSGSLLGPDLVGGVRLWRTAFEDAEVMARSALLALQAARDAARTAVDIW